MLCKNCGKKLNDGDMFCSGCGTRIELNEVKANIETEEPVRSGSKLFDDEEFKWDLAGYPTQYPRKRRDTELNWSSVIDHGNDYIQGDLFDETIEKDFEAFEPDFGEKFVETPEPNQDSFTREFSFEEMENNPEKFSVDEVDYSEAIAKAQESHEQAHHEQHHERQIDDEGRAFLRETLFADNNKEEDFKYGQNVFSSSRGLDDAKEEGSPAEFVPSLNKGGSIFYTGQDVDEYAARKRAQERAQEEAGSGPKYTGTNTFVLERVDIADAIQEKNPEEEKGLEEPLSGDSKDFDFDDFDDYDDYDEKESDDYDRFYDRDPEGDRKGFAANLSAGLNSGISKLTNLFKRGDDDFDDYYDEKEPRRLFGRKKEEPENVFDDRDTVVVEERPKLTPAQRKVMDARFTANAAMSDFQRDIEEASAAKLEEPTERTYFGGNKFYTFNQKSAEFQALLDEEYEKLLKSVKTEGSYDDILAAREEELRIARKARKEQMEAEEAAARLAAEEAEAAARAAAKEEAKRQKEEAKARARAQAEEEARARAQAEEEARAKAEEEARLAAQAEAEAEAARLAAQAEAEAAAPAETPEVEEAVLEIQPESREEETVEEPETAGDAVVVDVVEPGNAEPAIEVEAVEVESEMSELESQKTEIASLDEDAEVAEFEKKIDQLEEEMGSTFARAIPTEKVEGELAKETPVKSDVVSAGEGTEEAPAEAADDKEKFQTKVFRKKSLEGNDDNRLTYTDIFGDQEKEEEPEPKKKGGFKLAILDILIFLLAICVIITAILVFGENTKVGQKLQELLKIGGGGTTTEEPASTDGDTEAGDATGEEGTESGTGETSTAPQPDTPISLAIQDQKSRASNIVEVAEDTALQFAGDKDYVLEGVEYAALFNDADWYTDGDGKTVTYLPELVGTAIEFFGKLEDHYNTGSEDVLNMVPFESALYYEIAETEPEEGVTRELTKLQIGEVRQDETDFYMLVRTAETLSNSEDLQVTTRIIKLDASDYDVVVSEMASL